MSGSRIVLLFLFAFAFFCCSKPGNNPKEMDELYPWCIVAFDSAQRSPEARISMIKELGFEKYAYDWRDEHLKDMAKEIQLSKSNNIELVSVWMWLNAKRDSTHQFSEGNERMLQVLEETGLKTTIWLSFSNNFFEGLADEEALKRAIEMVHVVKTRTNKLACKLAFYNHKGWFGIPQNQVEIIKAFPEDSIGIVYNFHHGHQDMDDFPEVIETILPYLLAVNLNGMKKDGPKILPIGTGNKEQYMFDLLKEAGFNGPWGLLGHVEDADVKVILEGNIKGYKALNK